MLTELKVSPSEARNPLLGWLLTVFRAMVRLVLALRYRVLVRRYDRLVVEELDGVHLIILPEVFNPVLLRTGSFFARWVAGVSDLEGRSVLDVGTGSGIGAIFAARLGARVTAVDINPQAVRCAQINVFLNHLEDKIEVLQSDLFDSVVGQHFEFVLFNPPFYRGLPANRLDHAWRGVDVFERFANGLGDVLVPEGRAFVVLSSDGDGDYMLNLISQRDFMISPVASKNLFNEVLTVYEIRDGQP